MCAESERKRCVSIWNPLLLNVSYIFRCDWRTDESWLQEPVREFNFVSHIFQWIIWNFVKYYSAENYMKANIE